MNSMKKLIRLLSLVRSLILIMIIAIFFGTLGFLAGTKLLVLTFERLSEFLSQKTIFGWRILLILLSLALARGMFRYIEQLSNHYIAFKILELIRNKVFDNMRKLAPAKLENKDKGNLISILTSDIEAIEVFYAHTISPILIALTSSIIYIIWIGYYSKEIALISFLAYITIGVLIPVYSYKRDSEKAKIARNEYGNFNSYILETIKGKNELVQYNSTNFRNLNIKEKERFIYKIYRELRKREGKTTSLTDIALTVFMVISIFISIILVKTGNLTYFTFFIPIVILYNSFGPVLALSALSNNMFTTINSINRILEILDEKPILEENLDGEEFDFENLKIENLSFKYENEEVLNDISFDLSKNEIFSIEGKSGSGKSTILKLLMRFWEAKDGKIKFNNIPISKIKTSSLRKNISYVTQDTYIFSGTIAENLRVAKTNATEEEIVDACIKADIHDFIISLKEGYNTKIGRNNSLSAGQRQRIGIARAFLHDAPLILLDEPTSNLDIISEGEILKVLSKMKNKTMILVSHRKSTQSISTKVFKLDRGRMS